MAIATFNRNKYSSYIVVQSAVPKPRKRLQLHQESSMKSSGAL